MSMSRQQIAEFNELKKSVQELRDALDHASGRPHLFDTIRERVEALEKVVGGMSSDEEAPKGRKSKAS